MAAGNFTLYTNARLKFLNGGSIDLDSGSVRAKLYKGAAAASVSNAALASVLTNLGTSNASTNVTVKRALANVSVAKISAAATTVKFDSTNLVFTATGGTLLAQYVVFYNSVSANGGPLIGWCKLSTAQISVTSTNTLTINAPTAGWFVAY